MELHPILEEDVSAKTGLWYVVSAMGDRPSLRTGHSAVYVPEEGKKGKVVFIGGANPSELFSDIHILELDNLFWNITTPTGFNARYEHCSFVPKSHPNHVYVLAGANMENNLMDVQYYDITNDSWNTVKTSGIPPGARTHFTNAVHEDCIYIYFGGKQGAEPVQDRQIYRFDVSSNKWTSLPVKGDAPSPTHGHSLTCVGDKKIICFGGMAGRKYYNDLFSYDIESGVWTKLKPKRHCQPSERAAHAAVSYNNQFYIFGGLNKDGMALDDLWKFDFTSSQWTHCEQEGPAPACRLGFSSCIINWTPSPSLEETPSPSLEETAILADLSQSNAAGNSGDSNPPTSLEKESISTETQSLLLVHGGMDTQGEIFDDCLVFKISS